MDISTAGGLLLLLNEDLLTRIYSFLSGDSSDKKSFRATCKTFYRVDSLQRTHFRILRPEFLPQLLSKFPCLNSLDFSGCPRIDDGALAVLLRNGSVPFWATKLRRAVLSRSCGLGYYGLDILVKSCPVLEIIDVSYCCTFGDLEASAISCAGNLRDLRLDKCLGVTDVGLAKIAVGCGRLEKLSLKWCLEITDIGIDLLSKKCSNLKQLDVSYLKVTNEALRSISRISKLEVLAMMRCGMVDDVGLRYLGKGCPLLQVLDISRCDKLSCTSIVSVIKGHNGLIELHASYCFFELHLTPYCLFLELKNIKTLTLDGARIAHSSFQLISTSCKFLVEIGLGKCKGVTDNGILQLVSGCINLKMLNLTCCGDITDMAITGIAESCQNLVCLKLECCNLLTEKSLYSLGSFSYLLEELDLTDCSGVTDLGLSYLSRCSKLVCLKLGLCTNISDKGISYIASCCTKTCELDLYRCSGVGDDALASLSVGCKKLKKLNLSYCNKITDRGMKFLGHIEVLSDLEIRGLLNITSEGLIAVAAGCKRLAELDIKHCENIDDSGFWALAHYSRNLRQINLSNCAIRDVGLCMVMGNLTRLQDAKLVNLINVTVNGFELALRACCVRLKKVKLLTSLRFRLSQEIVEMLAARGCRVRWD
ncbi:F-box/LRR-repeat protein 3 isoform X1 [Coffea arabica]|uniref:F-box/LRR-repeat protein 3 isoform X1 n=1 Tax=Coffea arabica TaxID=13443 RepID=A0A6P6VZS0_COFAR